MQPELDYATRRRMVLGTAKPGEPLTLDEWVVPSAPLPAAAPPASIEPDVPLGVHAPSHDMDKRVRERMRVLDRSDSAYQRTPEELMAEDEGKPPRRTMLESAVLSRPPSPPARKILEDVNAQNPVDLNDAVQLLAQHPAQASDHAAWREAFVLVGELQG